MRLQKRRKYSKEFKEDVVNMIKIGDKLVSEIAKDLEINPNILYRWYKKYGDSKEAEIVKVDEKDKELRGLRKKLAEVEEERDILKKAITIFSKQGT